MQTPLSKNMKSSFLLLAVFLTPFGYLSFAEDTPAKPAAGAAEFQHFPPVEPKDAEKTFKSLNGFQMQLIAAEPLITDPVAMVYDENGLAYVVEMNDYPYTDKTTH